MIYIILSILYFYICLSIGAIIAARLKGIKMNIHMMFLIFSIPYIVAVLNIRVVQEISKAYQRNNNQEYGFFRTVQLFIRLLVLFYPFVYDIIYLNVLDCQIKKIYVPAKKRTKETIRKTYPKYRKRVLMDSLCALN